ncbi:hypothetical protein LTR53_017611, partial [Teratosphaeriaceae sp. CCFEE 6253]
MGRQQHLTRLALGRSAFQSSGDDEPGGDRTGLHGEGEATDGRPAQQYDAKGRPVNPATAARNAEMRRAQNSILALVGVVEAAERSEHQTADDAKRAQR